MNAESEERWPAAPYSRYLSETRQSASLNQKIKRVSLVCHGRLRPLNRRGFIVDGDWPHATDTHAGGLRRPPTRAYTVTCEMI